MFIPLGFGHWPRVIPIAIFLLVGVCVTWSLQLFPAMRALHKQESVMLKTVKVELKDQIETIMIEACAARFQRPDACRLFISEAQKKQNAKNDDADDEDDPEASREPASSDGATRAAATEKAKPEVQPDAFKDLGVGDVLNFVRFYSEFAAPLDQWPTEAKATLAYQKVNDYVKKMRDDHLDLAVESGLATRGHANFWQLLRASFTHADWGHLLGNLFFLIVFGIWVEQRAGLVLTLLVFVVGSFFGLGVQLISQPDQPVLGASAGISALMGSFFAFFYHAEFQFLFTLGLMYFKRVTLPLKYVFPVLYIINDFAGAAGVGGDSNVAHVAHAVGLLAGLLLGFGYRKLFPLPPGVLFQQELPLWLALRKSNRPAVVWKSFWELQLWNSQNRESLQILAQRHRELGLREPDPSVQRVLHSALDRALGHRFRYGSPDEMIQTLEMSLQLSHEKIDLRVSLKPIQLRQILQVADHAAQQQKFRAALPLYVLAKSRTRDERQLRGIQSSIDLIQNSIRPAKGLTS